MNLLNMEDFFMKIKKYKYISFLLSFLLALCVIADSPYTVYAENTKTFKAESYQYLIYHTNAYIIGYDGESTDIVFPEFIAGYQVVGLGKPEAIDPYGSRLSGLDNVRTVTIPGSVKKINSSAFSNYNNLKSVIIQNGVQNIGWGAFANCANLETILFPDSIVRIGANAFNRTGWYNKQNDGVVYAGKFAYGYKGEMPENFSLVLKNGTVGIAVQAFIQQSNLTKISVPDTLSCVGANSLRGTAWYNNQNNGIVYLGNVIYKYKGAIPSDNQIAIKDGIMGIADEAFYDEAGTYLSSESSVNLKRIIIPDTVEYIGDCAFLNCDNLDNLFLPNSVLYIGDYSYGYHTNGKANPTYSGRGRNIHSYYNTVIEDYAIYNRIGYHECSPKAIESSQKYNEFYYQLLEDDTVEITGYTGQSSEIIIPAYIHSKKVIKIGDGAFGNSEYGNSIQSVTIPDTVIFIGSYAFFDCEKLQSIEFGANIRRIEDSAFRYCKSLRKITIPDSVLSLGEWSFSDCISLTDAALGQLRKLNRNAFSFCYSLKYLSLGKRIIDIDYQAFEYCNKLNSVYIPDSVLFVGESAFVNCTALQSVYLRDNIEKIDARAFGYYTPDSPGIYEKLNGFTIYGFSNTVAENYSTYTGISFSIMSPIRFSTPFYSGRANESIIAELDILYKNYSAGDVAFESSNSEIAFVVETDGDYNPYCKHIKVNIKCLSVGTTTITAKLPDGNLSKVSVTVTEGLNGIEIYSDYPDLSVCNGSLMKIGAGILVDGYRINDISKLTYTVYDESILDVQEISVHENCRFIVVKAISPGTTYVSFSDSNTGYVTRVPVTVYDSSSMSFTVEGVPQQNLDKHISNFYNVNGMFVDQYSYLKNTNGSCSVSFDVYNSKYTYGAVEVYDENGEINDAVIIDKMTNNSGSIKEVIWDNCSSIAKGIITGDISSYRYELTTKKTSVSVTIPKNGYINITNDSANSFIVAYANLADCFLQCINLCGDIKGIDISDVYLPTQSMTKELLKSSTAIECFKNQPKFAKKLLENSFEKAVVGDTLRISSVPDFLDSIGNNLQSLDLDSLMTKTLMSYGISVGEGVFEKLSGVFGATLKGMFTFGDAANLYVEVNHLINSQNSGYITIQNQNGNSRNCLNVRVQSDTNFNSETALQVFRLYADNRIVTKEKEIHPNIYHLITNEANITYNIAMIKNGQETQIDKKVEVSIPLPEELHFLASHGMLRIHRVEENGSTTDMNANYKDGRLVFSTNHFSIYIVTAIYSDILIGDVNKDKTISISDVTEIQRHLAEWIHFSDEQFVLADTNGDGKVDISDATHLQKYLAEFDDVILGTQ